KDLGLALDAAEQHSLHMPATELVHTQMADLRAEGYGHKDCTLIAKYVDPDGNLEGYTPEPAYTARAYMTTFHLNIAETFPWLSTHSNISTSTMLVSSTSTVPSIANTSNTSSIKATCSPLVRWWTTSQ